VNAFEVAAFALAVGLVPCIGVCLLCDLGAALAAFEVASTVVVSALIVLCAGFRREPFIDLALVMALVSNLGALAFARMMEQNL
jgi:multisubunit Na+/H+ antiporter MnhF subunit